ncbi:MAG: putative drug resistance efflux protein, partial [Pseudonocardiales bacterium]|nr:putative drug resistance efflux protein [Pseudonocardiales bacterium]
MSASSALRRGIDASRTRPAALVLAVVCVAQFMVVLDVSIVNVALPNIQRDLGMSQNALGWVLNAYTLTFAGFLL